MMPIFTDPEFFLVKLLPKKSKTYYFAIVFHIQFLLQTFLVLIK